MQLRAIELIRVPLELTTPFRSAHGIVRERDVLLVHVICDESEGWAECVAQIDPSYTSEYVDSAEHVLVQHLLAGVLSTTAAGLTVDSAMRGMQGVRGHNMAKASVEVAVLDATLRMEDRSLADHLGVVGRSVAVGVAVGVAGDIGALLNEVNARVAEGYTRVKLKVMPGWDVEPLGAVRAAYPELLLVGDANGAYAVGNHRSGLKRLDAFGLSCIEQPLGERDLCGHAALAAQLVTPICLDEAITCYDDLDAALALRACSVVNLKVGRVGGLREAVRIHDRCLAEGVGLWCGGMLETGLGRAVNVALAALPGFTEPGDLSASNRYFATDLTEPFHLVDGHLTVPSGPGVGVVPRADVLALRTETVTLRP